MLPGRRDRLRDACPTIARFQVINTFRFHDDGTLAEEWVQYDNLGYYKQLGIYISKLS